MMETTKLSSKGQVILPKSVRDALGWKPGTEFGVEEFGDGVLLRPLKTFKRTRHEDVFACLKPKGSTLSIADMDRAVASEAKKHK
jgi:AbrB family looped-hinge helix DNA binding protein